jgi:beta-lactamase class A
VTEPLSNPALDAELDAIVAQFSGRVGYAIANLTTGARLVRREDEDFPTASTIKLPLLTVLHEHVARTGLDWDERVRLDRLDIPAGSGILQYLDRTSALSYRDLAWLMICLSDNLATNLIIDTLGLSHAGELIAELIDPAIRLRGAAGAGLDQDAPSMGYAPPAALGLYLDRLAAGRLPGAAETETVAGQQVFNASIPRYLSLSPTAPVPLTIAHKTGALPGARADIGIIRSATATLTLAVMTADSEDLAYDPINEGEQCIGAISRAVCRAWLDLPA